MSGGKWDYSHVRLALILDEFSKDETVKLRFPKISKFADAMGSELYELIKMIDYDISGDTEILDDEAFEEKTLTKIRSVISEVLKNTDND